MISQSTATRFRADGYGIAGSKSANLLTVSGWVALPSAPGSSWTVNNGSSGALDTATDAFSLTDLVSMWRKIEVR